MKRLADATGEHGVYPGVATLLNPDVTSEECAMRIVFGCDLMLTAIHGYIHTYIYTYIHTYIHTHVRARTHTQHTRTHYMFYLYTHGAVLYREAIAVSQAAQSKFAEAGHMDAREASERVVGQLQHEFIEIARETEEGAREALGARWAADHVGRSRRTRRGHKSSK